MRICLQRLGQFPVLVWQDDQGKCHEVGHDGIEFYAKHDGTLVWDPDDSYSVVSAADYEFSDDVPAAAWQAAPAWAAEVAR